MKNIPFKAVAVDMDGTFLNNRSSFNKEKFMLVMQKLKKYNIHFIVSSGNELLRCQNDMAEFNSNCDYVCENGSYVVDKKGKEIYVHYIRKDVVKNVLKFLFSDYPKAQIIISAKKHAYINSSEKNDFKIGVHKSYPSCKEITNLLNCPELDQVFKITLGVSEDKVKEIENRFNNQSKTQIYGVSGGGPWMDLINPNDNKGAGLSKLLSYLNISPSELIAFGDGGNDIEMLKLAGYSYAMKNGLNCAKKVAKFIAPSNNDDGVSEVLLRFLK